MNNYTSEGSLGIILVISLCTGLLGIILENNFQTWVSTLIFFIYASFYYIYAYGFKKSQIKVSALEMFNFLRKTQSAKKTENNLILN